MNSSEPVTLESPSGAKLLFHDLEFSRSEGSPEYWSIQVTLKSNDIEATANLNDSSAFEMPLPDFFADLATHWTGWQGEKEWSSCDGVSFQATCDKIGHITLRIIIDKRYRQSNGWRFEMNFILESGQLESIAKSLARLWTPPEQI